MQSLNRNTTPFIDTRRHTAVRRRAFIKSYLLYLIRWQLSTPILAPVIAIFKHSPTPFGTAEDWLGSSVANLIGGCIFYFVDRWIFHKKTV